LQHARQRAERRDNATQRNAPHHIRCERTHWQSLSFVLTRFRTVCGLHIVYCFCVFVGHAVQKIDELLAAGISYCQNGTKFGGLIDGAQLYITTRIGELWPEGSPGAPKSEGCKNSNAFLVHRLAKRDEIWHDDGHWCVAGLKGFWWTLVHFFGSTNFPLRISHKLLFGG